MLEDTKITSKEDLTKGSKWPGEAQQGETEKQDEEKTINEGCEEQLQKDMIDYPDGGLRAWGVILGAYVLCFILLLCRRIERTMHRFLTQFCSYG